MTLPRPSRLAVRSVRERRGRAALTATGVALGVALFVGSTIANATVSNTFARLLDATVGRADVVIQPAGNGSVPADAADRVRRLPGVTRAQAVSHAIGRTMVRIDAGTPAARNVRAAPGQTLHFPVFTDVTVDVAGLDRARDDSLSAYPIRSGRLPADGELAMAVSPALAAQLNARVGSVLTLAALDGRQTVHVLLSGILAESAVPSVQRAVAPVVVTTALAGAPVPPSEVDVLLADHVDPQQWTADHQRELGPGVQLQDRGSVLRPFRSSVDAPLKAISGVSLVALLVGMFLIYLTLSTTVLERTRHYGVMRAIGATRAQVRRAVLVEALAVGAAGTVVGLAAGVGVGAVMLRVVAQAVGLHVSGITVSALNLVVGAVAGLITTVAAAMLPARRAGRVPIVEAVQAIPPGERRAGRTAVAGGVLLMVGIALTLAARTHAPFDGLASLLLLGGTALAVPILFAPVARALVTVAGRVSPGVWRMAVRQSRRERSRSATTLGLVMVVFALVLAVDSGVAAVDGALQAQLRAQFGADLRIASPSFNRDTMAAVARIPGVVAVTPITRGPVRPYLADHPAESIELEAIDPASYFSRGGFAWTHGDDQSARSALARGGAVILPELLAQRIGARVGSVVRLATAAGPQPFRVAGRYVSMINQADLVVGATDTSRFGIEPQHELAVFTQPGRAAAVEDAVLYGPGRANSPITFQRTGTLRTNVSRTLNRYSRLYESLLGVALLIGVLGLANTLAMAAVERRREIGILRAIGTQRRTVAALFVAESATLTGVAYLLAVPLGALVAANVVAGVGRTAGIPATYHTPLTAIPALAVVALIVSFAAAAFPAHRAASTDPVTALRSE